MKEIICRVEKVYFFLDLNRFWPIAKEFYLVSKNAQKFQKQKKT